VVPFGSVVVNSPRGEGELLLFLQNLEQGVRIGIITPQEVVLEKKQIRGRDGVVTLRASSFLAQETFPKVCCIR
jgi:hypothetical protein